MRDAGMIRGKENDGSSLNDAEFIFISNSKLAYDDIVLGVSWTIEEGMFHENAFTAEEILAAKIVDNTITIKDCKFELFDLTPKYFGFQ